MGKTVLITGITGQDGSYLADLLVEKGYHVHGLVRRASSDHRSRIHHLLERITLHEADMLDQVSIISVIEKSAPDEIYNLAAQSFVPHSWDQPLLTMEFTAGGIARILQGIRLLGRHQTRVFQASSSEMFGRAREMPQNAETPLRPQSPYGAAKAFGHWITVTHRETYGMYCVSGILYNHESPRRGKEYVTRKISDAVARIKLGQLDRLELGNLDGRRDWGFAGDYVRAMWLMLQQPEPADFVIGTGEQHSVREFVELAFAHAGLDVDRYVRTNPNLMRPAETNNLVADPRNAMAKLGWKPTVDFPNLVAMMVDADLKRNRSK